MGKKRSDVAQRAWNVVRLALLWARKGGVFRRRLMMELRLVPKYLKNLGHSSTHRGQIFYQERELSFDETPIFHLKTHRSASMRFLMSCISPQVDFESCDFNADDGGSYEYEYDDNENEKCGDAEDDDNDDGYNDDDDEDEEEEEEEEEGIDVENEQCGDGEDDDNDDDDDDEEEEEEEGGGGIDARAEKFIAQFYQQMRMQRQISYLEYKETSSGTTRS